MGVSPKVLKQAIPLPGDLAFILSSSHKLRHAYVVGGAVRDALLGTQPKDFDIEVYGLSESALLRELKKHGQANLVGRSFGVIKLKTQAGKEYDFSLPRTERKTAKGHGGFDVRTDPNMDREQASARRDFTVNALFYDSREEHVMDYHGGLTDLNQQRLHPTSDAFIEDPLRVLRAMQFLSRFSFQSSEALVQRARSIVPTFSELSTERVRAEWLKWASQSRSPSRGLHFLRDSSWIQHLPELLPLSETPQDSIWHPEGNVFEHTCYVCDALASLDEWRSATEINRRILMFAALGHDLGKATTTQEVLRAGRRRIISPGHEKQSGTRLATFLDRMNTSKRIREPALSLVTNHMFRADPLTDRAIRRLASRVAPANIRQLTMLMTADAWGRPPLPREIPDHVSELKQRSEQQNLSDKQAPPLLQGRDLIQQGLSPGPAFGRLLTEAYEAQLEGLFHCRKTAQQWLANRLSENEGTRPSKS